MGPEEFLIFPRFWAVREAGLTPAPSVFQGHLVHAAGLSLHSTVTQPRLVYDPFYETRCEMFHM